MTSGALSGVRVLEFSEGVAGPLMARLLGDAGADVVKFEWPEGDRTRGWVPQRSATGVAFATLNRNKRAMVVDPSDDSDLRGMVALADVLIVDQEIIDRLRVALSELTDVNPRLVLCVISGWGPEGPWAGRAGSDLAAQLASEATSSLGRPGDEPVRLGGDHAGVSCALYGCQAILAALLVADDGGQRIDVSLFGSMVHMRSALWVAVSNPDEWWGFHLDSYTKPPEHFYTCKDRRVSFQVYRCDDFEMLIRELEMDFVFDDPRWDRFRADTGALGRYSDEVHDLWDRGLSQWTFAEAEPIFARHNCTLTPCFDHTEFLTDPHVEQMELVVELDDGGGTVSELRPPWQMASTPASIRTMAPGLDEHGPEIRKHILASGTWSHDG